MTAIEFNYHINTFSDRLKGFAVSLTNNQEDAKDLLQETMFRAIKYREKYTSETNLKAWLYTIMKNIFINNYRRKSKTRIILDDSDENYLLNQQESAQTSVISDLAHQDIQNLLDNLEPSLREAFTRYVEGYKYKEISDELGIPIGTVKSRIFSARKILMSQIEALNA